jgi:hypothetical protein
MTSTLRAWLAGLALAFSAYVLTLNSTAEALAASAGLAMFVIFVNAWMIAVGERATVPRGGLRVTRFPLGPRLLQTKPAIGGQFLVLLLVMGLATQDWGLAGWAALIVATVSIQKLRQMAWYVLPAAWLVNTLATMPEFHTLGDLVEDASGWIMGLVSMAMYAVVISGPLLRTDVGAPLKLGTQIVAAVISLPAYIGSLWLFTAGPFAGMQSDFTAVAVALLVGSIVQSLLCSCLTWAVNLEDRDPTFLPGTSAHSVGLGLMPMLLPLLACVGLFVIALPESAMWGAAPQHWMGLMALLLIVPLVPAVGLVGANIDRADRRNSGWIGTVVGVAGLGVWFVFGPAVLDWMYSANGPAVGLRAAFPTQGAMPIVSQSVAGGSIIPGRFLSGDLMLLGLPAADMCRAVTLMVLGCAALSSRYMRHARSERVGTGWFPHFLTLLAAITLGWLAMPKAGPVGAPLAIAMATAAMLIVDLAHKPRLIEQKKIVITPETMLAGETGEDGEAEAARIAARPDYIT